MNYNITAPFYSREIFRITPADEFIVMWNQGVWLLYGFVRTLQLGYFV